MKKIILILIIVIVVVFTGLLLYFFVFRAPAQEALEGEEEVSSGSLNPAAEVDTSNSSSQDVAVTEEEVVEQLGLFKQINSGVTVGATVESEGRVQFYDYDSQSIVATTFLGDDPINLLSPMGKISRIGWSPDKKKMAYETSESKIYYADIESGEELEMNEKIKNPIFIADDKIAYQYTDLASGSSTISVADPQNLDSFSVVAEAKGDLWLRMMGNSGYLAYYLSPNIKRRAAIYAAGLGGGSDVSVVVGQNYALDAKWSPDGSKMVYTTLGGNGRPQLWLANGDGTKAERLPFATFVDKITWSGDSQALYFGDPKSLPRISDYYGGRNKTKDTLSMYRLGLGEVELHKFFAESLGIGVIDPVLSPDEKLLFFRDPNDNSLYVFNLEMKFKELFPDGFEQE